MGKVAAEISDLHEILKTDPAINLSNLMSLSGQNALTPIQNMPTETRSAQESLGNLSAKPWSDRPGAFIYSGRGGIECKVTGHGIGALGKRGGERHWLTSQLSGPTSSCSEDQKSESLDYPYRVLLSKGSNPHEPMSDLRASNFTLIRGLAQRSESTAKPTHGHDCLVFKPRRSYGTNP